MTRQITTAEFPSVMDPQAVTLGKVYAEALLDSLPRDTDAADLSEQLSELAKLMRTTNGCAEFFANPAINQAARLARVEKLFGPFVSQPVASLLGVLAKNQRLAVLPALAEQYRLLLDRRMNRIDVSVTSAVALTREQVETLTATLAKKLGATPKLNVTVDPSLVGGLRVQVGDKVYDTSVAGVLQRFREMMEYKQ
ncbi:MAG: ATP synthase F1 subunit delta [Phycisphaerae bacterium]|nr:ATP synthase F1 subunit delta [Phycisphaerae bacterium]